MLVVDATALSGLARIGAFLLLKKLFGTIVIPPAVYSEVVTRGRGRPGDAAQKAGLTYHSVGRPTVGK